VETPISRNIRFVREKHPLTREPLYGLWANQLPESDYTSAYALDFAHIVSFYTDLNQIVRGFSRFKRHEVWAFTQQPLRLGIATAFLAMRLKKPSMFTETNAAHLRITLDSKLVGLGRLVNYPSEPALDSDEVFNRAIMSIDKAIHVSGLKSSSSSAVEQRTSLVPIISNAFSAAASMLEQVGVQNEYIESLREETSE
jgi:hypothetical protein